MGIPLLAFVEERYRHGALWLALVMAASPAGEGSPPPG